MRLKHNPYQAYTIVQSFDENDSQDGYDLYYYICKGNREEVQKSLEQNYFSELILYESDSPITSKKAIDIFYEIIFDYSIPKNIIKNLSLDKLRIIAKMGDFQRAI
jgi:hypothetical protein